MRAGSRQKAAQRAPAAGRRLARGPGPAYAPQDVPTYTLIGEDGTFLNTKPKRLSNHAAMDEINQSFDKAAT